MKIFRPEGDIVESTLAAYRVELQRYLRQWGGLRYRAIYIGGGTPSYLTSRQIRSLFRMIDEHGDREPGCEVSFEVHPEDATAEIFETLHDVGVNRVSMGVESFDDDSLKRENRRHTSREAIAAYTLAKSFDFAAVNVDLIYGLENQFFEHWATTLDVVRDLGPDSVTAYYMRLRLKSAELNRYQKATASFASSEEMIAMHALTFAQLEHAAGYVQGPVDWFTRPSLAAHSYQDFNWRQTDEVPLVGIGPSAYSYIDGRQYYNDISLPSYLQKVHSGQSPMWRGERLSSDDRLRRVLVLGLKIGIDLEYVESVFGVKLRERFARELDLLVARALVTIADGMLLLTDIGKLFADEVAQIFYSRDVRSRLSRIDSRTISTTSARINY